MRCLEYWVEELGVDGFRFDLASVFARAPDGAVMTDPPLPWAIEFSRVLSGAPLIAEAWDAAGLYHVGAFPGMAWAEWNGRYRDVVRRFVRGDAGLLGEVATRVGGSADLYAAGGRLPNNSINFVTCHDGFTLYDLVSYNAKHNEANGEDNRDGNDDNMSWNCGVEGDTADPEINALRERQAKNLLAILMLSRGVPMLLAGDEVLRTQRGNNNAYSQDNAISWFDWRAVDARREMLRFTRELIALRRRHRSLTANRFFDGRLVPGRGLPDVRWHGANLDDPGWHDPQGRLLAFTLTGSGDEEDLHVIFNMADAAIDVSVPEIPGRRWHVALDSAQPSPHDIVERAEQKPHAARPLSARAHAASSFSKRGLNRGVANEQKQPRSHQQQGASRRDRGSGAGWRARIAGSSGVAGARRSCAQPARMPPARALRRGSRARRAAHGRSCGTLSRLFQESSDRRDTRAARRARRGVRLEWPHRCHVPRSRRSTSPRTAPHCMWPCARRGTP